MWSNFPTTVLIDKWTTNLMVVIYLQQAAINEGLPSSEAQDSQRDASIEGKTDIWINIALEVLLALIHNREADQK